MTYLYYDESDIRWRIDLPKTPCLRSALAVAMYGVWYIPHTSHSLEVTLISLVVMISASASDFEPAMIHRIFRPNSRYCLAESKK